MAPPGFISDDEMAQLDAMPPAQGSVRLELPQGTSMPSFLSDDDMEKLAPRSTADLVGPGNYAEQVGRLAAGGVSQFIPFGDELTASGSANLSRGINDVGDLLGHNPELNDSYDSRLEEVRNLQKAYNQSSPDHGVLETIAGNAELPSLGLVDKAKGLAQTAKALAVEGGAYGGLFGLDAGKGGSVNRLVGGGTGAVAGSVFAPAVGGGLFGAAKLAELPGAVSDFVKPFLKSPEDIAAAKLAESKAAILGVQSSPSSNPLYQYQTLAEATQDPKLAQLEQQITKSTPLGNSLMDANRTSRQGAQLDLLNSLTSQNGLSKEEGGILLRQILQKPADTAKEGAEKLFETIKPGGKIPVNEARKPFIEAADKLYEAGGMPGSLQGIVGEVNSAAKIPSSKPPPPSGLLDSFGNAIPGKPATAPSAPTETYSYMHSLRMRAQTAYTHLKNNQDSVGAGLANTLVRSIDNAIKTAGKTGGMDPVDAALFEKAKAAFTSYSRKYAGNGPIGMVLRKELGGAYQYGDSAVSGMVFNGTAENTKKALDALPNTPQTLDKLRGLWRDKILQNARATTKDGTLSPGGMRSWVRNNWEGLTAKGKAGQQVFSPDHLQAIDRITQDLSFLDGSSSKSVKQLANRASEGQPTTAQALIMEAASKGATLFPGGGLAKKIGGTLLEGKEKLVNDILAHALFDKDFAKDLVRTATPQTVSKARSFLSGVSSGLNSVGKAVPQVAATSGFDNSVFSPKAPKSVFSPSKQTGGKLDASNPKLNAAHWAPYLIHQESSGHPNAVSPKGAEGLIQVMPKTAAEVVPDKAAADKLGVSWPINLKDPKDNLKIGLSYLQKQLDEFKDPELALAAYNAGPGAVKEHGNKVPPYRETQDYVKKILAAEKKVG